MPRSGRVASQLARRVAWHVLAAAVSVAVVTGGCATFGGQPGSDPVTQPVLVSADGKTITSMGPIVCGRPAELVAHSFPRKVTLTWLNPAYGCNAEVVAMALGRTVLRTPLGSRALVQADTGEIIPYFNERDLAHVTVLPHGFRLSSDRPTDYSLMPTGEPGDTRTYTTPGAVLSITQFVPVKGVPPLAQWPVPGYGFVAGHRAGLLLDIVNGVIDARSLTWAAHGYRFIVTIAATGSHKVTLSTAQLAAIAAGIVLTRSQYG